jgi:thiosulfate reductase cytochrome b subunit
MLRLFGIRPNRLLLAVAGVGLLAAGLAVHGPVMMALGGLAIVWSAATLVAGRRRRAQ